MTEQKLYFELLPLQSWQLLDMPVFIKNIQGRYLWANDFFIKKSAGLKAVNDIYKKQDHDFSWHEYANELQSNDKLLFESAQNINVRERIKRHDGSYVDIVTKKSPLFDHNQQLIGLVGFSLEIPKIPDIALLSRREHTIVSLMTEGHTDKEIAKKLSCSPRTIESHIINAKRKLMVATRAELLVKFCKNP